MRWVVNLAAARSPSEGLEAPQAPLGNLLKERMDLDVLEVVVGSSEDSRGVSSSAVKVAGMRAHTLKATTLRSLSSLLSTYY